MKQITARTRPTYLGHVPNSAVYSPHADGVERVAVTITGGCLFDQSDLRIYGFRFSSNWSESDIENWLTENEHTDYTLEEATP